MMRTQPTFARPLTPALRIIAVASTAFMLFACGGDDEAPPLSYVPADTGYVFANLAPVNGKAIDHMRAVYAPLANDYVKLLNLMEKDMRSSGELKPENVEMMTSLKSFVGELMSFTSDEKVEAAGFKVGALTAFYGIGYVPVIRTEYGDADKLRATITRLAKKAGVKLQEEKYGEGQLFRFGEEKVQMLVFLHAGHLIVSVAPKAAGADLLGLIAPKQAPESASATDKLLALQKKYRFTDDTVGFVESSMVTRIATGKLNALEQALWKLSGEPIPTTDPVCTKEFTEIAANFPRMVVGFDAFEPRLMTTRSVLEMGNGRGKAMMGIVPPMPNYGSASVFSFAMSIDPMLAMNFSREQANAILKSPYQCEKLTELNEGAAKMKESLANPALGMAAMIKGFGMSIDKLTLDMSGETPKPTALAGIFALFTDQPDALYGMMQAQAKGVLGEVPEQLVVGEVVELSGNPLAMLDSNFAKEKLALVRSNKMLAVGIGNEVSANLKSAASAKPGKAKLLEYTYGEQIISVFLQVMEKAAAEAQATGTSIESSKQVTEIAKKALGQFKGLQISVELSENGVEVVQESRMK